MIYVILSGGIGNQLFQYALYKELENASIDVSLDYSHLILFHEHNGVSIKKFLFNSEKYYEDKILLKLFSKKTVKSKLILIFLWQFKKIHDYFLNKIAIFEERNGYFDENLIGNLSSIKRDVSLTGYWQSEKYFINIRNEILNNLNYSVLNDDNNLTLLNDIVNTNSVSIHIRRGDYLSKNNKSSHNIFHSIEYYFKAISYFKDHCFNPIFFVFSDDPEWVKLNLNLEFATYIDWNTGENSYKDMLLMSKCKHNIIANSSFSWWGAWLNTNENKIVIAPEIWQNNTETPDIIPNSWMQFTL